MVGTGNRAPYGDIVALQNASTLKPYLSMYQGVGQSIPDNTFTALTWDTEVEDTHGMHSTSTNTTRVTIPSGYDGLYLCIGTFAWPAGTDYATVGAAIYKNAAVTIPAIRQGPNATSAARSIQIVQHVRCVANDYLELWGLQDNTANTARTTPAGSSFASSFQVIYQRS